eukprot:4449750-Pyramimonas_sp.AAC.1
MLLRPWGFGVGSTTDLGVLDLLGLESTDAKRLEAECDSLLLPAATRGPCSCCLLTKASSAAMSLFVTLTSPSPSPDDLLFNCASKPSTSPRAPLSARPSRSPARPSRPRLLSAARSSRPRLSRLPAR